MPGGLVEQASNDSLIGTNKYIYIDRKSFIIGVHFTEFIITTGENLREKEKMGETMRKQ